VIGETLRRLCARETGALRVCVVAFGKLGGRELNYSSDIDLLALCASEEQVPHAAALMEALRADLSNHTTEGYAYRVDFRLRPYGTSGQLVYPLAALAEYYRSSAEPWEIQALLKARPVAGDTELGREFLAGVTDILLAPHARVDVAASIDKLRHAAQKQLSRSMLATTDIKTGLGGIRDVEFLVQGLQLVHAHEVPRLLCGNTLAALEELSAAGILSAPVAERLANDYLFLRRLEHFLQIYEDRQTHSLPKDPHETRALARRMLGSGATPEGLNARLSKRFENVHHEYQRFVKG